MPDLKALTDQLLADERRERQEWEDSYFRRAPTPRNPAMADAQADIDRMLEELNAPCTRR